MDMMDDIRDRFWPRAFDEIADDPISLLNEPLPPDNVIVLPKTRSLHAILCENLASVEGLLKRLEGGVQVANSGRATMRDLYVVCRRQRDALAAALRLELS
jgi:hypothetical protein